MFNTLLAQGISWVFSKGFLIPLWIALCLGIGLLWRNSMQTFEARSILLEERLLQEKVIAASWKTEALRLQGIILVSGETLKACLDREIEEVQAQATLRRLMQDLRQRASQSSPSSIPSCTGHEQILKHLERPLDVGKSALQKFLKAPPETLIKLSPKGVLP